MVHRAFPARPRVSLGSPLRVALTGWDGCPTFFNFGWDVPPLNWDVLGQIMAWAVKSLNSRYCTPARPGNHDSHNRGATANGATSVSLVALPLAVSQPEAGVAPGALRRYLTTIIYSAARIFAYKRRARPSHFTLL